MIRMGLSSDPLAGAVLFRLCVNSAVLCALSGYLFAILLTERRSGSQRYTENIGQIKPPFNLSKGKAMPTSVNKARGEFTCSRRA